MRFCAAPLSLFAFARTSVPLRMACSSLMMTSGSAMSAVAAFTLFTFLMKTECLNLMSDLSSYLSCFGLKVRTLARNYNFKIMRRITFVNLEYVLVRKLEKWTTRNTFTSPHNRSEWAR